jgi:hypothetical protein
MRFRRLPGGDSDRESAVFGAAGVTARSYGVHVPDLFPRTDAGYRVVDVKLDPMRADSDVSSVLNTTGRVCAAKGCLTPKTKPDEPHREADLRSTTVPAAGAHPRRASGHDAGVGVVDKQVLGKVAACGDSHRVWWRLSFQEG